MSAVDGAYLPDKEIESAQMSETKTCTRECVCVCHTHTCLYFMTVHERVRLENEKGGEFVRVCLYVCVCAYSEHFPRILMNGNALPSFRTKRLGDLNFSVFEYIKIRKLTLLNIDISIYFKIKSLSPHLVPYASCSRAFLLLAIRFGTL